MKGTRDPDPSSDKNFSRSHGKVSKPIDEKGNIRLRNTVPGLNAAAAGTGSPSWVQEAARKAEGQKSFTNQVKDPSCNHRVVGGWTAGKPDRGTGPKLQDPDARVRATRA